MLLSVFTLSNAQEQRFRLGMKFSGNLSWISPVTSNIKRVGTSVGYSYGLMGDYNFQKYYALSSELLFTNIAGTIQHTDLLNYTDSVKGKSSFRDVKYEYKTQYVQLPVSIKFKTKEFGYWSYWVQFGMAPSFLTVAKANIIGQSLPFDETEGIRVNKKQNDKYQFDDFNDKVFLLRLPMIIGGGFEYSLAGNTSLYAGIRLDQNFADMFAADKSVIGKNNFVSLNLGVFF